MQHMWRSDSGPLLLPLSEFVQVSLLPTPRQIQGGQITLPFCSGLLTSRSRNRKQLQFSFGHTNKILCYRTLWITFIVICSMLYPMTTSMFTQTHVLHKEVHKRHCTDQNNQNLQNQKLWINTDFRPASNYRDMRQELHNIADYKDCKQPATNTASSLPDELKAFYACFNRSGNPITPVHEYPQRQRATWHSWSSP